MRLFVRRTQPTSAHVEQQLSPFERWSVNYRFTEAQLDVEHHVTITLTGIDEKTLFTQQYDGKEVYGKLLSLSPGGIKVGER